MSLQPLSIHHYRFVWKVCALKYLHFLEMQLKLGNDLIFFEDGSDRRWRGEKEKQRRVGSQIISSPPKSAIVGLDFFPK